MVRPTVAAGATAARRPAAGDSPDHDELLAADDDVRSAGAGVFAKWAESEQKELDDTRATSRRSSSGGAQQRRLSARGEVRQRVKEARARDRDASPNDAALANGTAPAGAPVKLEHATKEQRDKLFRRMDVNGNGTLSLAEIDKAIVELWPQFNRKKVLMRAYHAADVSEDQYVQRREFRLLLRYVVYFNNLWEKFEDIDANGDHRLDLQEFKDAGGHLGITVANWKAEADFKAMDANGGGYVMFDEFCRWCVGRLELNAKNEGASDDDEEDDEVYTRGGKGQYRQRTRKSQYSSDDDEDSEEEEQERAYESSRKGSARADGANGSLSSLASGSQSRTSSAVSSGFGRRRVSDQYLENLAGELERLDDEEAREEAALRAQAAMEPEPQAAASNEGSRDAPSSSSSSEDGEAVLGAPAPEPAAASDRREERGQEQRQEEDEEGGSAEGGGAAWAGAGDDQTARKLRQLDGKLTEALTKQAEQRSMIDKLHALLGKQREKAAAEKRRHMAEVDALQEELSRERRERRHLELQSREQRRSASVGRQRRSSVGAGEPSTPRSRRGSNPASPASTGGRRSSGAKGRRRSSRVDLDLDLEEEDGSERPRIFDKLTDPTQYTGSHKHRFDEHGNVRRPRPHPLDSCAVARRPLT